MVTSAEALCPRCRAPRPPGVAECPSCGVIYARFVPPGARPVVAAPAPRPQASIRPVYLPDTRLEALCSQLAELLEAGLPLRQVLTGPLAETLPPRLAEALRAGATAQKPLSDILEPLRVLDAAALALVRAGEARGGLPQALRHIAQRTQERRTARNLLLASLAYPALLLLCAAVILPAPVLFVAGLEAYLRRVLPPVALLGVIGLAVALAPRLPPDSLPRRALRALGFALPLTRPALRHHALATFADVLGSCLAAGLPMRQSLALAAGATPAPTPRRRVGEVLQRLDGGATLTAALAPFALPADFLGQLATGEHAGTLDQALPRLAASHREQARRATRVLMVAVGVVLFGLATLSAAIHIIRGFTESLGRMHRTVEEMERR